jgi:hypothetical protein
MLSPWPVARCRILDAVIPGLPTSFKQVGPRLSPVVERLAGLSATSPEPARKQRCFGSQHRILGPAPAPLFRRDAGAYPNPSLDGTPCQWRHSVGDLYPESQQNVGC